MDKLEQYRNEIDALDAELIALFERRMQVAREVGLYKKARNMEILNASREAIVIEKNVARVQDPSLHEVAKIYLQTMMDLSKSLQEDLMDEATH